MWGSGDEWLLLGGGSNTVMADEGFDGTVIRVVTRGIERLRAEPGDRRTTPWRPVRFGCACRPASPGTGSLRTRSSTAGRHRGALRHPGLGRRGPGAEHRCLRPGALLGARRHRVPRLPERGTAPHPRRGTGPRLPHLGAQAGPPRRRRLGRARTVEARRRWCGAWAVRMPAAAPQRAGRLRAARVRARRAARRPGAARRACARPCCGCAPPRAWCCPRTTRTR